MPDFRMKRDDFVMLTRYHEGAHAFADAVVGADVTEFEINPQLLDSRSQPKGIAYAGFVVADFEGLHQQAVALGFLVAESAESRILDEMGYTEETHPELREHLRNTSFQTDRAHLEHIRQSHPHLHFDLDAARQDSQRLIWQKASWEAIGDLGAAAVAKAKAGQGSVSCEEIKEILAPYRAQAEMVDGHITVSALTKKEQRQRKLEAQSLRVGRGRDSPDYPVAPWRGSTSPEKAANRGAVHDGAEGHLTEGPGEARDIQPDSVPDTAAAKPDGVNPEGKKAERTQKKERLAMSVDSKKSSERTRRRSVSDLNIQRRRGRS